MQKKTGSRKVGNAERSALLHILLPTVMVLLAASLGVVCLFNEQGSYLRNAYATLIVLLLSITLAGYIALRRDRYLLAAICTLAVGVVGPWGSLLLDPRIGIQDLFPLVYVTIPILMASIFLPLMGTIILTLGQLALLVVVAVSSPVFHHVNWPSLFAFVSIVSVLGIVMNHMNNLHMRQLQENAIHDYLTGLFNRRYLEQTLDHKILRGGKRELPLGLILFDIDHFKRYNDTHGHAAGDKVLQAIADMMFEQLDLSAIACRMGGDEFAVVLPEANEESTLKQAEALGARTKQLELFFEGKRLEAITISQGVAMFPRDGSHTAELLAHADSALFMSKQRGRNKVSLYHEEAPQS